MRKLLFFDIDGTLAYPQQEPAPSTVKAIRQARKMGHMAFISTGRTIDSIPEAISRIGFDGGIFSAGGQISLGQTVLFNFHMKDTLLKQLYSCFVRCLSSMFWKQLTADSTVKMPMRFSGMWICPWSVTDP